MVAETDTPAEDKPRLACARGALQGGRETGQKGTAVERQTVSIMKACEMVGVSRRTIYNWIAAGKVEYVRTAGGSIRIFVDTLWRQPDGATVAAATHV